MERKAQSVSLSSGRVGSWIEPGISGAVLSSLRPAATAAGGGGDVPLGSTPRVSVPPKTILFRNDPVDVKPLALFDVRVHQSEVTEEPKYVDGLLLLPPTTTVYVKDLLRPLADRVVEMASAGDAPGSPQAPEPQSEEAARNALGACFSAHIAGLEAAMAKRIESFVEQERISFELMRADAQRAHQDLVNVLGPLLRQKNAETRLPFSPAPNVGDKAQPQASDDAARAVPPQGVPGTPSSPSMVLQSPPGSQGTVVAERASSRTSFGDGVEPIKLILPSSASLFSGMRRSGGEGSSAAAVNMDMGDSVLFQFEEVERARERERGEHAHDSSDFGQGQGQGERTAAASEDEEGFDGEANGRTEEDYLANNDRGEVVLATSVPISIPHISSTPSAAGLRRDTMNRDQRERLQRQTSQEGQVITSMAASIQSLSRINMADHESFQPNSPGL